MRPDTYAALLKELQALVSELAAEATAAALRPGPAQDAVAAAHAEAEVGGRLEDFAEVAARQRAVRFILQTLYVRVLEDLDLLSPRRIRGQWSRAVFTQLAPGLGVGAYLKWILRDVAQDFPALLEDPWAPFPFPGDAVCQRIWALWHDEDGRGNLRFAWQAEGFDSRFLGDLYQDLDAEVRKHFALLQTPEFVEAWILDHTLTPALEVFDPTPSDAPEGGFRVIDPTCGSGHFLVGAFRRLAALWTGRGCAPWVAAERALASVWGCDINPHAVDIARFRLILEARALTGEADIARLGALPLNLAVMDSLIPWERLRREPSLPGLEDPLSAYASPAERDRNARFMDRAFHVVVGNPPYITPKDVKKRDDYRLFWPDSCHMKYALSAPFAERILTLGVKEKGDRPGAFSGQITANSFMKRQFGKALIEKVLPGLDLTGVVDTSGANIPGHGTPTVILFGRHRGPVGEDVWALLGKRGKPSSTEVPEEGEVWRAIATAGRAPDDSSAYITVGRLKRGDLASHPWSLQGGENLKVQARVEEAGSRRLERNADSIGITCFTLEDSVYVLDRDYWRRSGVDEAAQRPMVLGEELRDYAFSESSAAAFPYNGASDPLLPQPSPLYVHLWPYRTNLGNAKMFGGKTKVEYGLQWYEYGRLTANKLATPLSITFAFVATHNHFVLDRGGKVFNRTAPVIKLPADASEAVHLDLLGILNSSALCFWMKQVFQNRGYSISGSGARTTASAWEDFYEHDSTKLKKAPLTKEGRDRRVALAGALDALATQRGGHLPGALLGAGWALGSLGGALDTARGAFDALTHRMVALQEELDWHTYHCYGLLPEDVSLPPEAVEPLAPGHRPFEVALARADADAPEEEKSAWWSRHGHDRVTDIPPAYSPAHRARLQARLDLIDADDHIALLEQPAFKRRWQLPEWDAEVKGACEAWLLDRLEALFAEGGPLEEPAPYPLEALTAALRRDDAALEVAQVLEGTANVDLEHLVGRLVAQEAIPDNPRRTYSPKGLSKYAFWQKVWHLQDLEDAGRPLVDPDTGKSLKAIPVPPKFTAGDFLRGDYYKLRGKLNVPRERFIAFEDLTPPRYGWKGWRDLQRVVAQVGAVEVVEQDAEDPLPVPTAADPRRCGPTLGLWDSLPDLRRWGDADTADELEGLAKEFCQQSRCPCQVVEFWEAQATARGALGKKQGGRRRGATPRGGRGSRGSAAEPRRGSARGDAGADAVGADYGAAPLSAGEEAAAPAKAKRRRRRGSIQPTEGALTAIAGALRRAGAGGLPPKDLDDLIVGDRRALKAALGALEAEGKIKGEGVGRGRRYVWVG